VWSKLGGGLPGKRSNRYGHDKQGATLPRLVPDRIHNLFAADIDILANPRNYFKLNQFE